MTIVRMANLCILCQKNAIYTNGSNMLKLIKAVSTVTPGNITIASEKQER